MLGPDASEPAPSRLPAAFYVFWAGQGLSALGDAMTVVALPLVVLSATGSVLEMGKLTALSRLGALIATALAGFVIDGAGPRRVMIGCDLMRWLLLSSVPLTWSLGARHVGQLFLVAFGAALAQGIFYVGHVSLVAELVGKGRVGLANSRVESTIAVCYVFGPLLAGSLSTAWGAANVLGLDAATFLASAASLQLMPRWLTPATTEPSQRDAPPREERLFSRSVLFAGLRFLRAQPELWTLTLLVAATQFFTAGVVDLIVFRLKHEQALSDSATGVTFALASAAAAVAAAATPWLRRRFSFHGLWVAGVIVQAIASFGCARATSLAAVSASAAAYLGALTVLLICQASIRQELTPQRLLGRVTSTYLVLVSLPAPLGALSATRLSASYGTSSVLRTTGLGLLITALAAAATWAMRARQPKR